MVSELIVIGYDDIVSFCTFEIYSFIPVDSDKIKAIPIIPIDTANEVRIVLPFLVRRLLKLIDRAVKNDIDTFFLFSCFTASSSTSYGFESSIIFPSKSFTILVEYFSARSELWVTII